MGSANRHSAVAKLASLQVKTRQADVQRMASCLTGRRCSVMAAAAAVVVEDACYPKLQGKKEEQEESRSPMPAPMLSPRRACTPQSRLAAHGHRCAICGEHESAIRARDALAVIPNSERCDLHAQVGSLSRVWRSG